MMDKYAIATFIVCWIEGFICYLIGYMVGITHGKRTITHECVKTNEDQHIQCVEYVENDEKSHCWECKYFERMHETPIASDGRYYTYVVCTAKECHYEPQTDWHYDEQDATWYPYKHEDEPQQKSCATCKHALGNWGGESNNCGRCCGADRRFYEPKDEPQTEDEILREQCRAFMGIVEQTGREGE